MFSFANIENFLRRCLKIFFFLLGNIKRNSFIDNMATSSTAPTTIVWSWKCNADPFDKNQTEEWKRYPDLQIYLIEENYQIKEKYVELGDYIIDFKKMVQFKKDDKNRRRPVTREFVDITQYVREDRFCVAEKPSQISKSFGEPGEFFESAKLIDEWKRKYQNLCSSQDYSEVVEQAAKGSRYRIF